MAVGILSVGLMMIATLFPVGIYLTSVAAERTMAAVIADEAFAKIQLYGLPGLPSGTGDYNSIPGLIIDPCEFSYPSVDPCLANRQYYWSAVYKKLSQPSSPEPNYQITVFVARKTNPGLTYPNPGGSPCDRPKLIKVDANLPADTNFLNAPYVYPPAAILDNASGRLYRIVDRVGNFVRLDRRWDEDTLPSPLPPFPVTVSIWLIPPPSTGGKNADIEVYQRIIRF